MKNNFKNEKQLHGHHLICKSNYKNIIYEIYVQTIQFSYLHRFESETEPKPNYLSFLSIKSTIKPYSIIKNRKI